MLHRQIFITEYGLVGIIHILSEIQYFIRDFVFDSDFVLTHELLVPGITFIFEVAHIDLRVYHPELNGHFIDKVFDNIIWFAESGIVHGINTLLYLEDDALTDH